VKLAPAHVPVRAAALAIVIACAAALSACNSSGPQLASGGSSAGRAHFVVVAAEDFWGSLASQLAGAQAQVRSIVVDPGTDPHSYEPTAADARALASSSIAIVNGLGYDNWATQLLSASPASGRVVIDVGRTLGLGDGANPHRWYYPGDVRRVIAATTASYERIDPAHAAYFAQRRAQLEGAGLARYDALRRAIRARFAGTPIGYSESIFEGLGDDLGLRLLTPPSFAKAIAEGTDVTARDKQTVDAQLRTRAIAVWVQNSQNLTPDVQRIGALARARGIPVVDVTETLAPAGASFQQWQVRQLEALQRALAEADSARGAPGAGGASAAAQTPGQQQ